MTDPVVVYVDDEPFLCRAFATVTARLGFAIHTFTDPVEALEFLNHQEVLVVFSDFRMPKLNGIELLDRLEREVPFYIVSGELEVERLVDGHRHVTGILAKPFRVEHLIALMEKHRTERDLPPTRS